MSDHSLAPQNTGLHQLPPLGSSLYYVLHMVPSAHRALMRDWWHWWHEISSIPFNVQDPGVAEAKLTWWDQEIQQASGGQASHPLTQSMFSGRSAQEREARLPELPLWRSQINGQINLVHQTRWLDAASLELHVDQTTGSAAEGCAVILGAHSPQARQAARSLGIGWRQIHQLARLGQDARAGWVHVPVNVLQEHNVKAHELTKPAPQAGPNFPKLLDSLSASASSRIKDGLQAIRKLPRSERKAMRPLVALSWMQLALLKEIQNSQDRILHERLLLTPLKKWWIATQVRIGLLH